MTKISGQMSFTLFLMYNRRLLASVAELVDALDLGSSALRRGGSTPFTRTIFFIFSTIFIKLNQGKCA